MKKHLEKPSPTITSNSTPEDPTVKRSTARNPSYENYNFSFSDKQTTSFHRCSYGSACNGSGNGIVSSTAKNENHYIYEPPVERRKRICHYPNRDEQIGTQYQFQLDTPSNYIGQDFVISDYHHSYYPPRDRAYNNHGFEPNNNEAIASSNFQRFDDDQTCRFGDNLGPGRCWYCSFIFYFSSIQTYRLPCYLFWNICLLIITALFAVVHNSQHSNGPSYSSRGDHYYPASEGDHHYHVHPWLALLKMRERVLNKAFFDSLTNLF